MNARTVVVPPASRRAESWIVSGAVALVVAATAAAVAARRVDEAPQRLYDWQISAFYDLTETDQAIYNALSVAADELWWIHSALLNSGTDAERASPWPSVERLDEELIVPPFVRDAVWEQQGAVEWELVASFALEGSAVYLGSGGRLPDQHAYLLVLSHAHKGASYTDAAAVWVHPDARVAPPSIVTRDGLIVGGWKEVVPYSGAMEVDRLRGGRG